MKERKNRYITPKMEVVMMMEDELMGWMTGGTDIEEGTGNNSSNETPTPPIPTPPPVETDSEGESEAKFYSGFDI